MAGVAAGLCAPGAAHAADATAIHDEDLLSFGEGTLIVTARRVEEPVERVPISIATLDATEIRRMSAVTLSDIARAVPNLTIARASILGAEQPTIRGVFSPIGASTIGLYVDDAAVEVRSLEVAGNADLRTFDLDRVEVLRGPQGTLFGASSLGGTIRFLTRQPELTGTDGYVLTKAAATDHGGIGGEVQGAVGMPLATDRLGLRVGGYYRRDAGYIDRIDRATGAVIDRNIDDVSAFALRAAVKARLAEHVIVTPSLFYQKSARDDLPFQESGLAPYRQSGVVEQPGRDRMIMPGVTVQADLGDADLTAVTAYLDRDNHQVTDYSRTFGELVLGGSVPGLVPPGGSRSFTHVGQRSISQEVRLASAAEAALRWVVGAYFRRSRFTLEQTVAEPGIEDLAQIYLGQSIAATFGTPLLPGGVSYYSLQTIVGHELSGFGQLGWRFGERWEATAGVRVTRAALDLRLQAAGPYAGNAAVGTTKLKDRDLPVTPSFGLSYRPGEMSLLYLSAAKGFRTGGSNAPVPTGACGADLAALGRSGAPSNYGADTLWNYEAGVKAALPGRSVRMSFAAFQIDWRDIQQSVVLPNCGFAYIDNLGVARNRGFEMEVEARPVPPLMLNLSLGYVDARFRRTVSGGGAAAIVERGDRVPYVPRWSARIAAEYAVHLSPALQTFLRADYQYASAYRRAASTRSVTYNPLVYRGAAYDMVMLRAGLREDRWSLSLSALNLLNDRSILFRNADLVPSTGDPLRQSTPRPRTVELAAMLRF